MEFITFNDHIAKVLATVRADTEAKLQQAGDMVRDSMKAECPENTGKLKKSIRVLRDKRELSVRIIAGSKKAWYVHIVLFGSTKMPDRYTKKGKAFRGTMPPNNFMQRSLDQNVGKLKELFGRSIEVRT